jgi:hypothetical protein
VSFTAAAAAAAPVQSVAGRQGAISLAVADVSGLAAVASSGSYTSLQDVPSTFAPQAHTHGTADITGISSSFAAASHTHDAAAIGSGVLDLARIPTIGYTALSGVPTTFAPQAHTHSTADVVGLTAAFSQVGHTHDYAASIHTHSTADIAGYTSLPAQGGKAGPLVTDGTAASWANRFSIVDPVLVQGAGMTLSRDTAAGSITVAFAGGTSGIVVSSATPQPLGTASAGASGDASRADHVHLMPSAADVGAAPASHSHDYVQVLNGLTGTVSITGGAGVTVSTASSSITIAAAGSYVLPTATDSVLGGIKVGSGLTITDGVLAASGGSGLSWSSAPASPTASGTAGQISYDSSGHFYVCTAANTWLRAALSTWDSDATAFLTAAGITDATQSSAIGTLVGSLKSAGVWSKMRAIYPFIGGTASTHKWNLKDPRDLDAAYRLAFSGNWTHSATGVTPDGSTAYANTFAVPSTFFSDYTGAYGLYLRTNPASSTGYRVDMGAQFFSDPTSNRFLQHIGSTDGNSYYDWRNRVTVATSTVGSVIGFHVVSRTSTSLMTVYRNGNSVASGTSSDITTDLPNRALYIGAQNHSDGPSLHSNREQSFVFLSESLSGSEVTAVNAAVQAFQTALGRNV